MRRPNIQRNKSLYMRKKIVELPKLPLKQSEKYQ